MLVIVRKRLIRPNAFAFPGTKSGIDPGHPAASRIIFAGVPGAGNFRSLAGGVAPVGTLTGTMPLVVIGQVGQALTCGSTNKTVFTIPNTAFSPYTIAGIFYWIGTNASTQDPFGSDGSTGGPGAGISLTSAGAIGLRIGAVQVASTLPNLIANRSYFIAVSGVGGTGFSIAYTILDIGQIFSQTISNATAITGNTSFTVGNLGDGTRPVNGYIGPVMFSNVGVSLTQLVQWAADPWSFWYPRQ